VCRLSGERADFNSLDALVKKEIKQRTQVVQRANIKPE